MKSFSKRLRITMFGISQLLCNDLIFSQNFFNIRLFQTGIRFNTLSNMEAFLAGARSIDKLVILMFDGMHIKPHLEYNPFSDDIVGHEDFGPGATTTKRAFSFSWYEAYLADGPKSLGTTSQQPPSLKRA